MYVSVTKISTELGYAVFRTEITLKQNFRVKLLLQLLPLLSGALNSL